MTFFFLRDACVYVYAAIDIVEGALLGRKFRVANLRNFLALIRPKQIIT
jgi:hypothetical protein